MSNNLGLIRPIPIELVMLTISIGPDTGYLCVPTVVDNIAS